MTVGIYNISESYVYSGSVFYNILTLPLFKWKNKKDFNKSDCFGRENLCDVWLFPCFLSWA